MSNDEWVELRVLVVNTHVGMLLRTGVRHLLRLRRWHVVLLCEVQSPLARARLRTTFPVTKWKLVGVRPPSTGRGSSGTIVATRRDRLRYLSGTNRLITRARDRMHPERRLTRGVYFDRRARQTLMLMALHAWHIKGATPAVVAEHDRQIGLYALAVRDAHKQLQLAIFGGDVNETRGRGHARDAFTAAGAHALAWDHIDALLTSTAVDVRCVDVDSFDLSRFKGGEPQHKAIGVTLHIRQLS